MAEKVMNTSMRGLLAVIAVSLPAAAFAGSGDLDYCRAFVARYEAFLDQSQRRGEEPQTLPAKVAIAKCKAGDTSGIADLEEALTRAKLGLPPRT
jgi:hypothetical protein